ncbi:MAG: GIY-YIG nuclease family protein [Acidimicrobiia bacterium]|nr:GIY-YIG nuclease family protein [Gammaproteobacteria bacterium]MYI21091.1 GIY-YIG nuclease family protein [Acidimicrobiia bacterium]
MTAKTYSLDFSGYWRAENAGGLPDHSGIYCVYTCTFNVKQKTVSLRRLLYIGESGDVRSRVSGHERWDEWEGKLLVGQELCFSAALISPKSDRERAEAAMINIYKPPCNVEYVDSFPFDKTNIETKGKNALL